MTSAISDFQRLFAYIRAAGPITDRPLPPPSQSSARQMTFDFDVLFRDTEEPSEKIPRGKLERQMLQFRHNPMMIAFRSKSLVVPWKTTYRWANWINGKKPVLRYSITAW